jgi:hypothetical protein
MLIDRLLHQYEPRAKFHHDAVVFLNLSAEIRDLHVVSGAV